MHKSKAFNITIYILLGIFTFVWLHINTLPLWIGIFTLVPPFLSEFFSDIRHSKLMAYAYTHRRRFAVFVLGLCFILACGLYFRYPFHQYYNNLNYINKFILITQFTLQGAIVGLTIRILLLNLFADIIRARDIHKAKLLIMLAWIVFIIMFPLNERHRSISSIYLLGFGLGFFIHYTIRVQEKKDVLRNRLKINILALVESIKNDQIHNSGQNTDHNSEMKLSSEEIEAIKLYSSQKWKKLSAYIHDQDETPTLFFIQLAMLKKLHQYEVAIELINEKLEKQNLHEPFRHYYHLHYALNEKERFKKNGEWVNKDKIIQHLDLALKIDPNCLLTCATYALHIAGELNESSSTYESDKNKALDLMWTAMKINENKPIRRLVGYTTGMTVPVTSTFLLDSYGYVLLKCGKRKFSKALILQSLFQDPTFPATFYHLAEWYYLYFIQQNNLNESINDNWRQAAILCLQITIEMERSIDKSNKGTYLLVKAMKLLDRVKKLD